MDIVISVVTNVFISLLITIGILVGTALIAIVLRHLYNLLQLRKDIKTNLEEKNLVHLLVKLPAKNEMKEHSMANFLTSVHRILPHDSQFSLEIASQSNFLYFYIVASKRHKDIITSQIYAQFPDIEIEQTSDYWSFQEGKIAIAELGFKNNSFRQLNTFETSKENLLRNISAFMTTIKSDEQIYIQLALRRVGSNFWQRGIESLLYEVFGRQAGGVSSSTKSTKKLYRGILRIAFKSQSGDQALERLRNVTSFLKQFKTSQNELKFKTKPQILKEGLLLQCALARVALGGNLWDPEEIATLYHFPYHSNDVSRTAQAQSKKAPPPDTIPREGTVSDNEATFIGSTNYRNENITFGIKREDRRRHMYIVGKTGSGKSRLLELLMLSDLQMKKGLCLIDPHGDLAEKVLRHVPKSRVQDVVYIDPSDRDFPIPFNPLEFTKNFEKRQHVAHFFIAIFKKIFSGDWNERMEHILRFIILALLETPDSNILGIPRLLSDVKYRQHVVTNVQDPAVRAFWANEFSAWNEQYASQAIVPILNKVGQFISNPIIRNMIGQRKNALDFDMFMNEGKIVVINLSKGKLGDDNAALLGSMFITKIQQAALARASMPEEERRDFYFYIDEFQNFATDAFNSILSESRKYRLNLTVAHQYIDQLSGDIKSSVFGNVGSLIVFSVGGNDATYLAKEFAPIFTSEDMINLEAREMYLKLSINGRLTKPFSGRTLTTPETRFNYLTEIKDFNRRKYAQLRVVVEREIEKWLKSKGEEASARSYDSADPEPII